MRLLRSLFRLALAGTVTSAGALLMLCIAVCTLFRTRRFLQQTVLRRVARTALWCCGIRIVEHGRAPGGQHVFVSNHTSALDVVVVAALGLPNTRFFFSQFARQVLPIGVISWVCGTFFTPPQTQAKARALLFGRADAWMRESGGSVYLTPEGERIREVTVGPFNKGAFHLATSTGAPIAPFVIAIPPASDPEQSLVYETGVVDVHWLEPIPTGDWALSDLEANRDAVRDRFVAFQTAPKAVMI